MTRADVLTFGETMAVFRATGPLRLGGTAQLSVAGAESNLAVGLSRLGHAACWVGRVGSDELGELVLRSLRAENVDISHARTDPRRPTGLFVLEPRAGHLMRASYYRAGSAGSAITARDVLPALARRPRILHVTGITPALNRSAADAVSAVTGEARALGVTVCLDVNYRSALWPAQRARDFLQPLARSADIVIASDDELPLVAGPPGGDPDQLAAGLLAAGAGEVVVTRGADGAVAFSRRQRAGLPARPVPVTDVVGAGDAFAAGYLSGVLDGLDLPGRLGRAITAGAFAVSTRGDWEGLPTRRDLETLDVSGGTTLR